MFNEERYKKEIDILNSSKNFVKTLPILSDIFNELYWNGVRKQLGILRADSSGTINPVFHLVLEKDKYNNFVKIKQLENYLNTIFKHTKQENRNYIKKELQSLDETNSLNMLYEINVLGYLLNQFSTDRIQLYPKTILEKNVDARINFGKRDIYIEITALGDSKFTKESIANVLKSGKAFGVLPNSDEEKDIRRILSRLKEKEKQFIPKKPNILLIFMIGCGTESISVFGLLKRAIEQETLKNIGLIMEFDRQKSTGLHKDGCDDSCFITEDEENNIKNLFTCDKFETLVYP